MTLYDTRGSTDLNALKTSDGTAVPFVQPTGGVTLANSTTYVFPIGSERSPVPGEVVLTSVQLKWDSAVVATFTIETTNFPATIGGAGQGGIDVKDWDTAKGNWIQENPSTAYISVTSTDGTTGGATVTNATIAVAGGTAGGCVINLGNIGARRMRIKAVVTTGGVVRVNSHGKLGA